MAMVLTSVAFPANGPIPKKYTGEGEDTSPPLSWNGLPRGVKQLALICDDPDAPTPKPWVHWVVYRIPPDRTGLPENADYSFAYGQNDFGTVAYGGPMPPEGHKVYHYLFHLYALDSLLPPALGSPRSNSWPR
jgi:Raf kinase inhibitor-like YbhB/YbcL family protein